MSDNRIKVPGRLTSATTEKIVVGADEVKDDVLNKTQQKVNADVQYSLGHQAAETNRVEAKFDDAVEDINEELANRYVKSEVNNIVSRTPETDVIVYDVPAEDQEDIAAYLDEHVPSGTDPETGQSVRANKLYRVPGPTNTTYSEWAWDGEAFICMANKDYGIDKTPLIESTNVLEGGSIYKAATKNFHIYPNHYFNRPTSSTGQVVSGDTADLLVFLVNGRTGWLKFTGLSSQNTSPHLAAFSATDPEGWINDNYLSYMEFSSFNNKYIKIDPSAAIYCVSLKKESYPDGYDGISIIYEDDTIINAENDAKLVNYADILTPSSVVNGYEIINGETSANEDYRICSYSIDSLKRYVFSADITATADAQPVHYYNGSTYLGTSKFFIGLTTSVNRKFSQLLLDVPAYTDTIKIVEIKTSSYILQEVDEKVVVQSAMNYLAEGMVVYPSSTTSIVSSKAFLRGSHSSTVAVVDISENNNYLFIDTSVTVTRIIFCNSWGYGEYSYISYINNPSGIISIPSGADKAVFEVSYAGFDEDFSLPLQFFSDYTADQKKELTNKIVLPTTSTKNLIEEDGTIVEANEYRVLTFNVSPDKTYTLTTSMPTTTRSVIFYYDNSNNLLGKDVYKSTSGVAVNNFEKVVLHIPYKATKIKVNAYANYYNANKYLPTMLMEVGSDVKAEEKSIEGSIDYILNERKYLRALCGEIADDSSVSYYYNNYVFTIDPSKYYALTAVLVSTHSVFAGYFDSNNDYICDDIYYGNGNGRTELSGAILHIPSNASKVVVNGYSTQPAPSLSLLGDNINLSQLNEDVDALKNAGSSGLPAYYNDYLNGIEEKIQKAFLLSEPLSDAFTFITDVHYPHVSGNGFRIIRQILDSTPIDKAICGGDIDGRDANEFGEEVEVLDAIVKTRILYDKDCSLVRGSGKPLFAVRGNHDYSLSLTGFDSAQSGNYCWFADWASTRNIFMNDMEQYDIVTDPNSNKSVYFYKDYPSRKLRYIYVDTVDTNQKYGDNNNSQIIGISDSQIQWIVEQAVMTAPQDYDLIFISHICPEGIVGGQETIIGVYRTQFKKLADMLTAIQEKTVLNLTLNSVEKTYDLTSYDPNILIYKSGHLHREAVAWYGYWGYASACEWSDGGDEMADTKEYGHFHIDTSHNTSTSRGTIYESLVDAVIVNGRENVKVFRIGAGVNRIFNQEQITVNQGSTVTLESSLDGAVKWWCYDSTNYATDPNSQYKIIVSNDFAEINENTGVLTAKTFASGDGYVTAMAYSETDNAIEYFGVKVI